MLNDLDRPQTQPNALHGSRDADFGFDFIEAARLLWRGKWLIIGITLVFSIAGLARALYLPNIYRAEALLAPAEETQGGGLAAMAGQLGGLASLAGVNLPKGQVDKASLAVEVLKSRAFVTRFIERREILVPLMAAKKWDPNTRMLEIDVKMYDADAHKWVRKVTPPKQSMPSSWEAYKIFNDILQVTREKDTGFVTISVDHVSPELAHQWVTWLVSDVNEHLRRRDIREAKHSVSYLQAELEKTAVADMQKVFYQLIEKQIQTMMLANVRTEYVFKTVDASVEPEEKHSPKRALICIVATLIGVTLGVILVLIKKIVADAR